MLVTQSLESVFLSPKFIYIVPRSVHVVPNTVHSGLVHYYTILVFLNTFLYCWSMYTSSDLYVQDLALV